MIFGEMAACASGERVPSAMMCSEISPSVGVLSLHCHEGGRISFVFLQADRTARTEKGDH